MRGVAEVFTPSSKAEAQNGLRVVFLGFVVNPGRW